MKNSSRTIDKQVAAVFDTYPNNIKPKLLFLRELIFETASQISMVSKLDETLKWGEPSYVASPSKMGSTIRIAWKASASNAYAIYFKCTANLVPAFKEKFPKQFNFGGNRSILFQLEDEVPLNELKQCIALALTYHRNKNLAPSARWEMVTNLLK